MRGEDLNLRPSGYEEQIKVHYVTRHGMGSLVAREQDAAARAQNLVPVDQQLGGTAPSF